MNFGSYQNLPQVYDGLHVVRNKHSKLLRRGQQVENRNKQEDISTNIE